MFVSERTVRTMASAWLASTSAVAPRVLRALHSSGNGRLLQPASSV